MDINDEICNNQRNKDTKNIFNRLKPILKLKSFTNIIYDIKEDPLVQTQLEPHLLPAGLDRCFFSIYFFMLFVNSCKKNTESLDLSWVTQGLFRVTQALSWVTQALRWVIAKHYPMIF